MNNPFTPGRKSNIGKCIKHRQIDERFQENRLCIKEKVYKYATNTNYANVSNAIRKSQIASNPNSQGQTYFGSFPQVKPTVPPLITTIYITLANIPSGYIVNLPISTTGTQVSWGDGTNNSNITTHTYVHGGTYSIVIHTKSTYFGNGSSAWHGSFYLRNFYFTPNNTLTNLSGAFTGAYSFNDNIDGLDVSKVTNMSYMFFNCRFFNRYIASWNTSNVVNMNYMFTNCFHFNQEIGSWNTSQVTNMNGMFLNALVFNQSIVNWNTTNVTDMSQMFFGAQAYNQPLYRWNTSNVTDMSSMFNIAIMFNQPIDDWDTSSVTDMSNMFNGAEVFNQPIGNWNTSSVTDMSNMFNGATNFNQDISTWQIPNVTTMAGMLVDSGLSSTNYSNAIIAWDLQANTPGQGVKLNVTLDAGTIQYSTSAATARNNLITAYGWTINDGGLYGNIVLYFQNVQTITLPIQQPTGTDYVSWGDGVVNQSLSHTYASPGNYTVSIKTDTTFFGNGGVTWTGASYLIDMYLYSPNNITSLSGAFWSATNFTAPSQNISSWDTSQVTNMSYMFVGTSNFNQPIDSWNTSNVTDMSYMFFYSTIFNQQIGSWNTSQVTNMSFMFYNATNFNQPINTDLVNNYWNTSNVTNMRVMFGDATNFNQTIYSWNTSSVTDMSSMFYNASSFNQIISTWKIPNVTNMSIMLQGSGLSSTNYSNAIIAWDLQANTLGQGVKLNVTLDAGTIQYSPTAATARNNLITVYGWTINDGGQV